MKKCPFCAEEIQDAAVKCRFCGSMLADAPPPLPRAAEGVPPVESGPSLPWIPIIGFALAMIVLGVWLALRAVSSTAVVEPPAAATLAPPATTPAAASSAGGEYRFLDVPWGASRPEVRKRLASYGIEFIEQDEDGDDQYAGEVEGRQCGIAAMFADERLVKVIVVLLAPDDPRHTFATHFTSKLRETWGDPQAPVRAGQARWPARRGLRGNSHLYTAITPKRHVAVHFESGAWAEEQRRREARATAPVS